ncbi:MAG: nucleotidyltransferase family protein [Bdellovibrionales bacterium]
MKFGLSLQDWDTVEKFAILPLKKLGAKVFVFGSRARGVHRKFSDLDLMYEIINKPELHIIGKIKDDLVDSSLPIKVDLVDLDELADSYKGSALSERVEI